MDAERDGAIPLAELADIVRSLQQTIDQIARAVDDRSGRGRPPWILKKLSTLKAIRFDSGRAALVIEAPHDVENLHIDFREADACVQALQLFVDSLDALSRGEDPPVEIGEPASKSLRFFVNVLGGYDRV